MLASKQYRKARSETGEPHMREYLDEHNNARREFTSSDLDELRADPNRTELLITTWESVGSCLSESAKTSRDLDNYWSDSNVDPINAAAEVLSATMAFAYDDDDAQLLDYMNALMSFAVEDDPINNVADLIAQISTAHNF